MSTGEPHEPLPARLGKYDVLARVGAGGMAEVFVATPRDPRARGHKVAIKRMRPALTRSSEFVNLFLEEAKTASLLAHPNICHVHELSSDAGDYFMVMEYLEGVPLTKLLARQLTNERFFDLPLIIGIVEQASQGLHHAHELRDTAGNAYNIVHRDVSPPNIFVTYSGLVKILDFGISKSRNSMVRTMTGQIRGKFSYMAPEHLMGETLDRRADVFALAVVLFELLAGQRLFKRVKRLHTYRAITKEPIPRVDQFCAHVPPPVVEVLDRALTRDRDRRTASALQFATELRQAMEPFGGLLSPREIGAVVSSVFVEELTRHRAWLASAEGSHSPSNAGEGLPTTDDPTLQDIAPLFFDTAGLDDLAPGEDLETASTSVSHPRKDKSE